MHSAGLPCRTRATSFNTELLHLATSSTRQGSPASGPQACLDPNPSSDSLHGPGHSLALSGPPDSPVWSRVRASPGRTAGQARSQEAGMEAWAPLWTAVLTLHRAPWPPHLGTPSVSPAPTGLPFFPISGFHSLPWRPAACFAKD